MSVTFDVTDFPSISISTNLLSLFVDVDYVIVRPVLLFSSSANYNSHFPDTIIDITMSDSRESDSTESIDHEDALCCVTHVSTHPCRQITAVHF